MGFPLPSEFPWFWGIFLFIYFLLILLPLIIIFSFSFLFLVLKKIFWTHRFIRDCRIIVVVIICIFHIFLIVVGLVVVIIIIEVVNVEAIVIFIFSQRCPLPRSSKISIHHTPTSPPKSPANRIAVAAPLPHHQHVRSVLRSLPLPFFFSYLHPPPFSFSSI